MADADADTKITITIPLTRPNREWVRQQVAERRFSSLSSLANALIGYAKDVGLERLMEAAKKRADEAEAAAEQEALEGVEEEAHHEGK